MNPKPLAIVIPAYKSVFLEQALESIACQSDKDFRLYIGDDCSPQGLEEIVTKYQNRIDLVYHRFDDNLGGHDLVAQWERCIAMTKGEPYIWLFSDDDVMDSDCVARFNALPREVKENSIIHFDVCVIDENSNLVDECPAFPKKLNAESYLTYKLHGKIVSYVVEFIFPRNIYEQVGGFQNFDLAWGSDFMTWIKMAAKAPDGIVTISDSNSKVNWRRSGENISPNKSREIVIRKNKSLIENALFIKSLIDKGKIDPTQIGGTLRCLRFPLGDLKRNASSLTCSDILKLALSFSKKIGFSYIALPYALGICVKNLICRPQK